METKPNLKSILAEFFPLHRTLSSEGMDQTYQIIASHLPPDLSFSIESYPPFSRVWTWTVPERYIVHEAYLETEDGGEILNFKDHPLHLVSYSPPVDKLLTWEELAPHLHFSEKRPEAVPWEFKYYERNWGFCLSKHQFEQIDRHKKYHARIHTEFSTAPEHGLKVGTGLLKTEEHVSDTGEFILLAHTCHPAQANDDGAGVVCAIELARRLSQKPLPPGSMDIRFLFGPETIGTVAYLANHEEEILRLRGGIFLDTTGNQNSLALQRTRQNNHLLDRIARHVLSKQITEFREGDFAQVAPNDERIINGPGVNVPCIALSRFPYPEYHTSDDNLDILHEELLVEAVDVAEEIVRIYASNYLPKRTFRGPLFLSGDGRWGNWHENWDLNRALEKVVLKLEGTLSIFDIAEQTGLEYQTVRGFIEKLRARGLVTALPIISEASGW